MSWITGCSIRTFAVSVILPTIPMALFAQEEAEEPAVLRVNTRLVQVDVIVLDGDGPVADLTPQDFTLFDEGLARDIELFAVTRSETEALDPDLALPEGVVSNRLDRRGRTPESATVILIDRFNTLGSQQSFMDHQVRDFLTGLGNDDRVAVYELTDGGLTVLEDYTSHPDEIRNAMNGNRPQHSLALGSSLGALDDVQMDRELAEMTGRETGTRMANAVSDYYVQFRTRHTAAALEAITQRLSDLPGRKNLVWLAASFPFTFRPHQNVNFYNAITASGLDRIDEVSRMMIDANVAIYPVDARGLGSEPTEVSVMMTLADMTGGRASMNTNGLATAMRRAVRDTQITYTLGFYVAEDEVDDAFHALDIRVAREDVDVRHRRGYYGFGGEPAAVAASLGDALSSAFDATALGLLAKAEPVEDASGNYDLAVIADMNDLGLSRDGDLWVGSLTVVMYYYDLETNQGLVFEPEVYPIRLSESRLESARRTGLVIHRLFDTSGRPGYLRIAVQDSVTGATGSLWVPLGIDG